MQPKELKTNGSQKPSKKDKQIPSELRLFSHNPRASLLEKKKERKVIMKTIDFARSTNDCTHPLKDWPQ